MCWLCLEPAQLQPRRRIKQVFSQRLLSPILEPMISIQPARSLVARPEPARAMCALNPNCGLPLGGCCSSIVIFYSDRLACRHVVADASRFGTIAGTRLWPSVPQWGPAGLAVGTVGDPTAPLRAVAVRARKSLVTHLAVLHLTLLAGVIIRWLSGVL